MTTYQNCMDDYPEHNQASLFVDFAALNFEGYKTTVFPIITQNCAGCHATGIGPTFGDVNNPEGSFRHLYLHGLISETMAPSQNGIVIKISSGHNDFSANPMGQNIQKAITDWQAGIP
jgi:hypothetical protein